MFEFLKPEKRKDASAREVAMEIGGKKFNLQEYNIGQAPKEGVISPGNMETGNLDKLEELFREDPSLITNLMPYANFVPYSFMAEGKELFGDYTTPKGQDEFKDSDLIIAKNKFSPPKWVEELWEYAKLKRKKVFKTDNTMACVRSLSIKNGKPVFTLGSGKYSDSFYSNGIEGLEIGLSDEEKKSLSQKLTPDELEKLQDMSKVLEEKYGKGKTIREVIFSHYGRIPEFGDHIYNNSIGVAGMVLTKDNEFVFVKRGSNVSVNQGINCTASGAAEFDEDTLSQHGIQHFLGNEMSRETNEELGLKAGALIIGSMKRRIQLELGIVDDTYELIPVGFIRELSRGGKPECMFLIRYKSDTQDLVEKIRKNTHAEKKEIEGSVFSFPLDQLNRLLNTKGATSRIQHKGIVNLVLCNEYLKS